VLAIDFENPDDHLFPVSSSSAPTATPPPSGSAGDDRAADGGKAMLEILQGPDEGYRERGDDGPGGDETTLRGPLRI
jgi:hypothetical protein